jgi:hypothetical protein
LPRWRVGSDDLDLGDPLEIHAHGFGDAARQPFGVGAPTDVRKIEDENRFP